MLFKEWVITEAESFFDYHYLAEVKWKDLLKEAGKKAGMSLYFENDDKVVDRVITVPQDYWEHSKCRFKCQMRAASSDWQDSVIYFRCQLVEGYALGLSKYGDQSFFIYIPTKGEGNDHLVMSKSGKLIPKDYEKDNPKSDQKKCWKSLEVHLKKLVDAEGQCIER